MITKLNDSDFTLNCLRDDVLFELEVIKGKLMMFLHRMYGLEMKCLTNANLKIKRN